MKRRNYFFDLDFAKEESYLRKMNQEGWALVEVKGFSYTFQESPKEDMVYRIDVMPFDQDDWEDYLTIFEEAGWTFVTEKTSTFAYLAYFAKSVQDFEEGEEWDIYSDKEAKLVMMKRRLIGWLGYTFFISFSFLQLLWKCVTDSQKVLRTVTQNSLTSLMAILYFLILLIWFGYFLRMVGQYVRYKRRR